MLYLDTDVVVMANLDELWSNEIEPHPDALFHWGGSLTSAFVVMDAVQKEHERKDLLRQLNRVTNKEEIDMCT